MIKLSSFSVILPFLGMLVSCHSPAPSIEFTKIPGASEGSPFKMDQVEGRVTGRKPGQQIVLYAKAGIWWVQPFSEKPFTEIQSDSTWRGTTHPGTDYAALLVDSGYHPPLTAQELPAKGGQVAAIVVAKGMGTPPMVLSPVVIRFSGYDWEVRRQSGRRVAKPTPYDPANVWTDPSGFLHLRVGQGKDWAGGEVQLRHSLGEGLYRFTVRDISKLDSATELSMFTWDAMAVEQHHREVDIELSRRGDPASKNAQFAVQPSEEPANVVRFEAPAGTLTYSFRWEPGKISFSAARGTATIAAHEFTSGVPSPGGESVVISLFAFENSRMPVRKPSEVVIEKFEFLP